MRSIEYFYKDKLFELNVYKSSSKNLKADFYIDYSKKRKEQIHTISLWINPEAYLEVYNQDFFNNTYFKAQLDHFLDLYIENIYNIRFGQNDWILNPGKLIFLGKIYDLNWEVDDNIKNDHEFRSNISDSFITLYVTQNTFKRILKKRAILISFLDKELLKIVQIFQKKYEELFNIENEIPIEIVEKLKKNAIATAWHGAEERKIQYTTTMVCTSIKLIEKTVLHEVLHHFLPKDGHNKRFYKLGEDIMLDFKLLHKFNIPPGEYFKKI